MFGSELLSETTVLLLVVVTLVSLWLLSTRRPPRAPPGPGFALPVLGHLHLLMSDRRQTFAAWRRQYGDVFSLYLGKQLVVVLAGYDVIKDAMVKQGDVFCDRPPFHFFERLKSKGVVYSSGPVWKAQRKTTLEILREFGMGKNILAEKIQEEVKEYVKAIADKKGQPLELTRLTQVSVSNNICSIVFGKRFEYDDPVFNQYMYSMEEITQGLFPASMMQIFPWLRFVPGDPFAIRKFYRNIDMMVDTVMKTFIDRHIEDYDESSVDDFISAYIRETRKEQPKFSTEFINEVNLRLLVLELFVAGTETAAATIRWTIACFLHHPDVQDKCYEEIHRVVGTERTPTIHDRPELVYLEATIMEVLRYTNVIPFVQRFTAADVELSGCLIPKNTKVVVNLHSVLHAPEIWGDPDKFRPERFIGQDCGLIRFEELIPFNTGRRMCLGEGLARVELFLYLSAMIQSFHFLPAETEQLPSLTGTLGVVDVPPCYFVRAIARQ